MGIYFQDMILKIYFGHYDFSVTVSFKLLRFFIEKFSEDIKGTFFENTDYKFIYIKYQYKYN